jgi:hypothetical protein
VRQYPLWNWRLKASLEFRHLSLFLRKLM